jgi:hypothetical protein
MGKFRIVLKNTLLAFVLVSVGYSLGRHSVRQAAAEKSAAPDSGAAVHVYYFHASFRCVTCNTIERMTKELMESRYKGDLASGRIIFSDANFQKDEELAKRYGVAAGCVVVSLERDGRVINFQRLDEVWTLNSDKDAFDKYISGAVDTMLKKLAAGAEK